VYLQPEHGSVTTWVMGENLPKLDFLRSSGDRPNSDWTGTKCIGQLYADGHWLWGEFRRVSLIIAVSADGSTRGRF
jgi:hypothetical protein